MKMILTVSLAAALMWVPIAPAAAAPPRCHGKVATIVGTGGNDHLVGTDGRDVIVGLAGADRIEGRRGGDDVVQMGRGSDTRLNAEHWQNCQVLAS